MSAEPILFGGWTYINEDGFDPCSGGHVNGTDYVSGEPHCPRCGRAIDQTRCLCGTEGHASLSRSYCPVRMRFDRRDAERHRETLHAMATLGVLAGLRVVEGDLS